MKNLITGKTKQKNHTTECDEKLSKMLNNTVPVPVRRQRIMRC